MDKVEESSSGKCTFQLKAYTSIHHYVNEMNIMNLEYLELKQKDYDFVLGPVNH